MATIARLKPGAIHKARELLAEGPPFDPAASGCERHDVYLSGEWVVFVFEGLDVATLVEAITTDLGRSSSLAAWMPLVDGLPRILHCEYHWAPTASTNDREGALR
jgi:hypothetical protein